MGTTALGGVAGWLYSCYEEPKVAVTSTTINSFNVTTDNLGVPTGVTMSMTVVITIDNPSKKPLEATLTDVDADIKSLDKNAGDGVGTVYDLGIADLAEEADINAKSKTDVAFNGATTSESSTNANLAARINEDCVLGSSTNMRVTLKTISVEVWRFGADLPAGMDYDFTV